MRVICASGEGVGKEGQKRGEEKNGEEESETESIARQIMALSCVSLLFRAEGTEVLTAPCNAVLHFIWHVSVKFGSCVGDVCLTSLSPDCSPPYLLVPIASSSSIKIIAPYRDRDRDSHIEGERRGGGRMSGMVDR